MTTSMPLSNDKSERFYFWYGHLLLNPYPTAHSRIDDYPSMTLTSCNSLILDQICSILVLEEAGNIHHSFGKKYFFTISIKAKWVSAWKCMFLCAYRCGIHAHHCISAVKQLSSLNCTVLTCLAKGTCVTWSADAHMVVE